MDITKFNEKYNRVEGNIYTIEEIVNPINGVYEAELIHDNVNNINVYTGSKLTGDKINTYTISTPSLTPWKTVITIYSNEPKLYITYETTGDTVEADDINNLQDAVNETQEALNNEITRATNRENTIESNLNKEIDRAKAKENEIVNNLNAEATRAKNAEKVLTDNLASEVTRAKAKESQIDAELANRYTKDKVYTKEEVLSKIEALINNAPDVLDTFKEIADALGNDPNFATTMTTLLSQKVDKVTGKGLSTNDFTDTYKNNLIDSNNKKHEHSNKSIIDTITSALISNWNSAFTHISDAVKHITSAERTLWNTVSNKLDKSGGTMTGELKNNTSIKVLNTDNSSSDVRLDFYNNIPRIRYGGNGDGATNGFQIQGSSDFVKLKIDDAGEIYSRGVNKVYHEGNKPTKADVGLGNIDNTSDLNKPISTATQNALNGKANSSHTHTKSQITDMPTKMSQFTNDMGYITSKDVDTSQNHVHSNKTVLDKITQSSLDNWNTVSNKADKTHTHDDRYYTESEIDTKLNVKVNKGMTWNQLEGV